MEYNAAYQRFMGIFPAIATALAPNEDLDEPAQRRIVEYMISGGVNGLWVLGTGGETAALTDAVRRRTVQVVLEAVNGRVPLVAGVSEAGTRRTIDRIRAIEDLAVDAVFVSAPYYFIHTPEDMLLHFNTILESTDLPVIIYNNPFNTHNTIPLAVLQELAKQPQVIGIKDSGGNFAFTLDVLRLCQSPTFRVFTGTEELFAASVLMGAEGAVLAIPVIAPRLARDLFQAARAGDKARALQLQAEFNSLIPLLGDENGQITDASFLGAVKMALVAQGLCEPTLARPLSPISERHAERIRSTLQARGLLREYA